MDIASDHRVYPFFQIDNAVIDHFGAVLGPYGIAVYVCIVRHVNRKTGVAFPGMATIARETGMSRRRVLSAVRQLQALGLLMVTTRRREDGGKTAHHYTILPVAIPVGMPPEMAVAGTGTATDPPPCESGAHGHVNLVHIPCESGAHEQDEVNKTNNEIKDPGATAPGAPQASPPAEPARQITPPDITSVPSEQKPRCNRTRSSKQQANDELWDAIAAQAFGGVETGNRGRIGLIVRALRQVDSNAAEYTGACAEWRRENPGLTLPRGEGTVVTMVIEYRRRREKVDGHRAADGLTWAEAKALAARQYGTVDREALEAAARALEAA